MPMYCFTTQDGEIVEKYFAMKDAPKFGASITLPDGRAAVRDVQAEHGHMRVTGGNWPMWSTFAGCHPDQIPEMKEQLRSCGTDADYDPKTGDVCFRSRGHRAEVLRALGMFDRSAGYGDPAPLGKNHPIYGE